MFVSSEWTRGLLNQDRPTLNISGLDLYIFHSNILGKSRRLTGDGHENMGDFVVIHRESGDPGRQRGVQERPAPLNRLFNRRRGLYKVPAARPATPSSD